MDYKGGGAADTPYELAPVSAADQSRGEPPSDTDDLDAFWKAISLQAEARAARYAIRPGSIRDRGIEPEERVSLGRAFNLVLAFTLGVAVCAQAAGNRAATKRHQQKHTHPFHVPSERAHIFSPVEQRTPASTPGRRLDRVLPRRGRRVRRDLMVASAA